ncbi:MAG TPA: rhomboid family intramembrane serine protease [Jiangellaceae bacterium]|nr:rhomboid family intramembrane serine protease [Jiangellaceae bacterium]
MSLDRTPRSQWYVPVVPVVALLAVMWASEIADTIVPVDFDQFGIQPRTDNGLVGVLLAPLLHGGFGHLVANTGAFLVLGATVAWTTRRFWVVTITVAVLGGLATWLTAPGASVHIGASGLVYGYAAFLVGWGIWARKVSAVIIAALVVLVYGGLALGVLPGQPGVSWQGHLFGALAGLFVAWWLASRTRRAAPG